MGRRETRLPLPQDAGDAILACLEAERPTATDRVFLTARAPIRPITSGGLRDVVWHAIERAGVRAPSRGTHVLHHSLATRLVREGATLDTIGAALRHRDVNTTRGETHVRTQTATEWAATAAVPWQRERRLKAVAGFVPHARAEDPRHEVAPIFAFGRRDMRPRPHIHSPDEIKHLLDAAPRLPATWPLKPRVFPTLLGLLASTDLCISEALALRFGDITRVAGAPVICYNRRPLHGPSESRSQLEDRR